MSAAAITFDAVTKTFDTTSGQAHRAVHDVSLTVADGEFVCLVGPSGCGKSTLLALAGGFERPTDGRVLLGEAEVCAPGAGSVTVFQDYGLFPWRSVRENVEYGLQVRGVPAAVRRERAEAELAAVGLAAHADRYPHELSGGMRQRVSIARALAVDPGVLLMDEPFGAVDAINRARMQEELERLWREHERTVLFVTHDVDEAIYLADRIVLMTPGPGRIAEEIEISLPRPRARGSREFFEVRTHILEALHLAGSEQPPEFEI